jgi:hypothetical protein
MVVAESSDESMRMRVLGFAKVIANLGMENGGGMKDGVRCDTLMQQADKTGTLKSSMLGQIVSNSVSAQGEGPSRSFPMQRCGAKCQS